MNTKNHKIMIRIEVANPKLSRTIIESLSPEVNITQKAGTKINIDVDDSVLILSFEAQSIARLRAVCNSYLRWIVTIINTIEKNIETGLSDTSVYSNLNT